MPGIVFWLLLALGALFSVSLMFHRQRALPGIWCFFCGHTAFCCAMAAMMDLLMLRLSSGVGQFRFILLLPPLTVVALCAGYLPLLWRGDEFFSWGAFVCDVPTAWFNVQIAETQLPAFHAKRIELLRAHCFPHVDLDDDVLFDWLSP